MSRTKQYKKDKWERERVQRVLDYHNKKYGTHIAIKGKTTEVYPQLEGQLNWDWVCYDAETGEEIAAIEVKRLTDPELEERGNIMWQLLEEVTNSLSASKKLPGTFSLSVEIPKDYYLPFNKQENKQKFKDVLLQAICRTAQRLKSGETKDLKPQIIEQLPFVLPDVSVWDLHKFSDEGNALYKGSGTVGWWSPELDGYELENFQDKVSQANKQLSQANVKQTFLVIIEEGHRVTCPDTVAEALKRINHDNYSYINHIYYVSGEEVEDVD